MLVWMEMKIKHTTLIFNIDFILIEIKNKIISFLFTNL